MLNTFVHIAQLIMVNIQSRTPRIGGKQAGASALEYLVLAGALVAIMIFAFTNDTIKNTVSDIFSGLFDEVPSSSSGA
ncbi:hypothetical protein D777_03254 [Marinobacter nitratireducens]|uniref:Flp pilus assembly protein, pilin Flp n=1 Tax=Marinobacter nitratireducens TaxID=1137280 RepID=A0A072MZF1_9GAMM|nr:hypothetical protein [Marinobacter nitratireducens]KEF30078.1 hypothetical protein D777_03254 [Marinobacter nitratireducens]